MNVNVSSLGHRVINWLDVELDQMDLNWNWQYFLRRVDTWLCDSLWVGLCLSLWEWDPPSVHGKQCTDWVFHISIHWFTQSLSVSIYDNSVVSFCIEFFLWGQRKGVWIDGFMKWVFFSSVGNYPVNSYNQYTQLWIKVNWLLLSLKLKQ